MLVFILVTYTFQSVQNILFSVRASPYGISFDDNSTIGWRFERFIPMHSETRPGKDI